MGKARAYRDAIIDGLVECHIYTKEHDKDARKALHDLISFEVQLALDPRVSHAAASMLNERDVQWRDTIIDVLRKSGNVDIANEILTEMGVVGV